MKKFWLCFKIILWPVIIMTVMYFANASTGFRLLKYGVEPRVLDSLPNIYLMPFLHGSFQHLSNNLIGFIIFSTLCILRGVKLYLWSSFFIITASGLLVWLFGRPAVHIGASGWIFGLWSLSIMLALFNRSFVNIIIALIVVFLYGGMIYGVLPNNPSVSFEAHLFGALAGAVAAWLSVVISKSRRGR
ncbi:putative membrane protein [Gynuella sunshinyii YC6258]|uniref:Putative membrane protein n=2 Tax=Gynuella sunshinyii TaxID=1445505 RepID=A0A0C5VH05_9GAMM|nr:putative membrane protein [Gynuella sunshinyii YC6258]